MAERNDRIDSVLSEIMSDAEKSGMMRCVQSGERSKIKEFKEKIESLKNDIIELEDQLTQILSKPQNKGRR